MAACQEAILFDTVWSTEGIFDFSVESLVVLGGRVGIDPPGLSLN
jgi:hypothetical protein